MSVSSAFKGGYGFAPMLWFIEPLGLPAGMLRPGGATANNASDQLTVIDQAIGSLPAVWQAGHRDGDDPELVERRLVVRADTAGDTAKVWPPPRHLLRGMRANEATAEVIESIDEGAWVAALNTDGPAARGCQQRMRPVAVATPGSGRGLSPKEAGAFGSTSIACQAGCCDLPSSWARFVTTFAPPPPKEPAAPPGRWPRR